MTFCLNGGGCANRVKSDYALAIIHHSTLTHIPAACEFTSIVAPFFTVHPNSASCTGIRPHYTGVKPPERIRAVRKISENRQQWPRRTQQSSYAPGLYTPSSLSRIVTQPRPSSLNRAPPSHHPFK